MNLSILPPSDLLRQVEGIERGLERQRRVGAAGRVGLAVALLQAMVVVVRSDYWDGLVSTNWHALLFGAGGATGLLDQWPFLLALAVLLGSVLLIAWNRFWLQESREPFRYTFAVDDFTAITEEDPSLAWLRHHLSERLNKRIGRLSILEEAAPTTAAGDDHSGRKRGAPAPRYESHVHIRGHYGTRIDRGHWVIEVVPRVRVGPKGSPETMAHPETYRLNPVSTKTRDGRTRRTTPNRLNPEDYEKLLERVYFSVATEIYRQITRDVQHKIDLLPTTYLRATAYLHEAEDYARSNTLVAFDEAERLFEAAIRLYDPARRPWPTSVVRWPGHALRRVVAGAVRQGRRLVAFAWRRAAKTDLMVARAETGYANVLLDRRSLAGMSGYRLNPIFESRPVAQRAVDKLRRLPRDVSGMLECLFDAHVTLALSWASIGSLEQARGNLEEARRLLPTRATVDARFAYAAGVIETRPRSKQLRFQRAVELDPASESAQFALAFETEKLWRTKPELETDVAQTTVDEYERVLTLNPGNIVAWGNLGYVHWLLSDGDGKGGKRLDQARDYFERGRDYKEIKRETYVADIDYGLARVAAETGEFNEAYKHFMSALTAHMAQSTAQSATDSWSSLSEYLFVRIDLPILERFERYKNEAERLHGDHARAPQRVRDSVLAFVVNDYGEACYNYYKRSFDERYLELARANYLRSAKLDPSYAIPRHNLFLLNKEEDALQAERDAEQLYEIEPDWFEAKLAIMWKHAGHHERKTYDAYKVLRRQEESVRRSVDATRAASDDERQAIVFEPSRTEELPNQLTPYEKPKEARWKATEAKQLMEGATRLTREHKGLLAEREKDRQEALKILRQLVPHQWLWRGRLIRHLTPEKVLMSRAMVLRRWRLDKEWRWEREFDNVHVKALYEWGRVQLSLESPRSPSEKIFRHIEAHFWHDNFHILQRFRQQLDQRLQEVVVDRRVPISVLRARGNPLGLRVVVGPYLVRLRRLGDAELRYQRKIDGYNRILAGTLLSRLHDDPTSYWALSGVTDGLATVTRGKAGQLNVWYSTLNRQDRRRFLLRVLDGGQFPRSPALYRWLGDQLVAFRRELDDRKALARLLEAAANVDARRSPEQADAIRRQLESRDWRGLEGTDLRTCRRVLKSRDRDALRRIAAQMRPDDDLGGSSAAEDRLRQGEVKAYEKALASDDPKLVWTVVEPLQRLGERERSREALRAYEAMGSSRDAVSLWTLADGYGKVEDWKAAGETFRQALEADDKAAREKGARVRHADLYHWEIARARWGEGSYGEAFAELELITGDAPKSGGQPPDRDEPAVWTRFVAELLSQKAISDLKAYHTLRSELERRQRAAPGPDPARSRRDAGGALLLLIRARRQGTGGPTWSVPDRSARRRETLPVVTPIMLHADSALFPEREKSPIRRLTAAYARLTVEVEEQMGVRIPGVLVRASEDKSHKDRHYVVKLHEIPLFSETAPRAHAEQRIVADGIGPAVCRYLDTYLGHAEVQELLDQLVSTVRPGDARSAVQAMVARADRLLLVQVLQRLVREAVPVTRLEDILKVVTPSDDQSEVDEVVTRARAALVDQLPQAASGIGLGPEWEATLQRWVRHADGKRFLAVPVHEKDQHERLLAAIGAATLADPEAVIVVRDDLRRFARALAAPRFPSVRVLGRGEWAGSPAALRRLEAPAELVRVD